jgi:hypothetical protein
MSDNDWIRQAQDMEYASRPGDLVKVNAPADSMGAKYNGCDGVIHRYEGGWVVVGLYDHGLTRFRADELLAL